MSVVQSGEWHTHHSMEHGRGCNYAVSSGKKVPLAADGTMNPYVCMDPVPPILEAMRMGDSSSALRLVRTRPDIDADAPSLLGTTPLMAAAAGRHVELVRSLLNRACDVHRTDELGCTALLHAAGAADEDLVSLLLEYRSDATKVGVDGQSALHICARHGLRHACSALLHARANPDVTDAGGLSAWHVCPEGSTDLVQLLHSERPQSSGGNAATQPSTGTENAIRLLLLPCLGGFAEAQFPHAVWKRLEDKVSLIRVDYPGHGARAGEPLLSSMTTLTEFVWREYVVGAESTNGGQPWAVVGHSMGAVIAYEIARRAQSASWLAPVVVVLAAAWPPQGYGEYAAEFWSRDALEDDDALIQRMVDIGGVDSEAVQESEIRQLLLPIWRADLTAELGYTHRDEPRLGSATTLRVLAAAEDRTISPAAVKLWANCAENVEVLDVPGGHFLHLEGSSAAGFVDRVQTWLEK